MGPGHYMIFRQGGELNDPNLRRKRVRSEDSDGQTERSKHLQSQIEKLWAQFARFELNIYGQWNQQPIVGDPVRQDSDKIWTIPAKTTTYITVCLGLEFPIM